MNLRDTARAILYVYQRAFWYVGIAKSEAQKPLGFWNETILILTFLAVSGYRPTILQIILAYILLLTVFVIIGKIVVVLGIPKFLNSINNEQNPELMKILSKIEELERIIKKQ